MTMRLEMSIPALILFLIKIPSPLLSRRFLQDEHKKIMKNVNNASGQQEKHSIFNNFSRCAQVSRLIIILRIVLVGGQSAVSISRIKSAQQINYPRVRLRRKVKSNSQLHRPDDDKKKVRVANKCMRMKPVVKICNCDPLSSSFVGIGLASPLPCFSTPQKDEERKQKKDFSMESCHIRSLFRATCCREE